MRFVGLVLGTLFALSAQGNIDVTCYEGDCFTKGWEVFDTLTRDVTAIKCRSSNCREIGWTGEWKGRTTTEIECKLRDCFGLGWRIFDSRSGRMISHVRCLYDGSSDKSCLTNGWDVLDVYGQIHESIRCTEGDCENMGWDVFVPGYPRMISRCKLGGCFQSGWIQYR